jgi:hypothetical protein
MADESLEGHGGGVRHSTMTTDSTPSTGEVWLRALKRRFVKSAPLRAVDRRVRPSGRNAGRLSFTASELLGPLAPVPPAEPWKRGLEALAGALRADTAAAALPAIPPAAELTEATTTVPELLVKSHGPRTTRSLPLLSVEYGSEGSQKNRANAAPLESASSEDEPTAGPRI